jgi:stringent starvation protein B
MTSLKPHLFSAVYDWIVENNLTHHLLADATIPGVVVPADFIEDGKIILNISPSAAQNLIISQELVGFNASFNGKMHTVTVPIVAVMAIYAKENGKGMMFYPEPVTEKPKKPETAKPVLRVVK